VVDESAADAAALGIQIEPAPTKPEHFEVWEENWLAVEMFLRVQTQWRSAMGGLLGLDYGAVEWLFNLYEVAVEDQRSMLEDLQVMEATVIATVNKRSD
jgi:hypothetical protein